MSEYSEEFEAFCEAEGYSGDVFKANLWKVWCGSRAAIEVTLPERIPPEYRNDYWAGAKNGFNQCLDSCRISIEQAGVKVKK